MTTSSEVGCPPHGGLWPEFSLQAHRRWLTGDCYAFALALVERLPDGALVGIGGNPRFPGHVGLQHRGRFLDIRGALDETGFRAGLAENGGPIFPLTIDDVALQLGFAGVQPPIRCPEMTAARRAAKPYLAWLKVL